MALVKSCGTCEHCRIGSKMCGTCVNYDNWEAEKVNEVKKEYNSIMTMEKMITYLTDRGYKATKKYSSVERLYHFYIQQNGVSLERTFKYPAIGINPTERTYIMKKFLDNMIADFEELAAGKWRVTDMSVDGSDTDGCHVEATIEANLPHSTDFVNLQDELEKKLNANEADEYCKKDVETAKRFYKQAMNSFYGKYSPFNSSVFPDSSLPKIKNVIFSAPATVVIWMDDTKTVVKCGKGDIYDPEKGLAMAISKKVLGNKGNYYETYKYWLEKNKPEDETNGVD